MRWPSFLTRRPAPTPAPIDRCDQDIAAAVARRRAARLARPKVLELRHEIAMQQVEF